MHIFYRCYIVKNADKCVKAGKEKGNPGNGKGKNFLADISDLPNEKIIKKFIKKFRRSDRKKQTG